MTAIRTRFAPSPTGHLHIGGARTALFNWLMAHGQNGTFILRIEDTDAERSTAEYTRAILDAMAWLGLDWDEGPFYQSERKELHLEYINRLLQSGRAYYCHCTPEELEESRNRARAENRKPKYDGRCRDRELGPAPGAVVRFRGPLSGITSWSDMIKGPISFDNTELDDLVILRSDGMPTYNMAVVVDDLTMGITHIVRGDDHVNNTPRQLLLYQALDAPIPRFAHVPMILGEDKARLSKRHGATSVMAYREQGYLPEAMINYLVRLGWSHGDEEIFILQDLVKKFDINHVGRSAGVFSPEKLLWLNEHYIKESAPERLADLAAPYLQAKGYDVSDREYLARAAVTLQPRSNTMADLAERAEFYVAHDIELDPQAAKKFLKPGLLPLVDDLMARLETVPDMTEKTLEDLFRSFIETHDIKLGKIAQPVRVALTGKTFSPGLFEIMDILGKERVMKRMRHAREFIVQRAAAAAESTEKA